MTIGQFECRTSMSKSLSLELGSPRSARIPHSPAQLRAFLDKQRNEKEQQVRRNYEVEHSSDLQAIAQWRTELETAKRLERSERARKKAQRVQMEKEYALQYRTKAALAAQERASEEARLHQVLREAQEEEKRQEQQKLSRRHAFQAIIHTNEVQRTQTVAKHLAELQKDADTQRQLATTLARTELLRQQEVLARVLRQQRLLDGRLTKTFNPDDFSKRKGQTLYREMLDSQVQERRRRDLQEWRAEHHNEP